MALVSLIAFDGSPGQITAYAQETIPTGLKAAGAGASGGGGGGAAFLVTVGHGQDAASAVHDAQRRTSHRLSFDQIEVVLLTDRVAEDGEVPGLLDFFERGPKTRVVPWLYIMRADQLQRILAAQPRDADYPAQAIVYLSLKQHTTMATTTTRLYQVYDRMLTPGRDAAVPRLEVEASQFAIGPTAVFRRSNWVGDLDRASSDVLPLLVGWRHGQTALDVPCGTSGRAAVETRSPKLSLKVEVTHGRPTALEVRVAAAAGIDEVTACQGSLGGGPLEQEIVRTTSQVLYGRLARAISRLQALDSDVMGFGAYLRGHDPDVWQAVEPSWYAIYPHLPVHLSVVMKPDDTGLLHMGEPTS